MISAVALLFASLVLIGTAVFVGMRYNQAITRGHVSFIRGVGYFVLMMTPALVGALFLAVSILKLSA